MIAWKKPIKTEKQLIMDQPKIALVVGNGLSMSFGHFSGLTKNWNSQSPLSWDIECPQKKGQFIDQLPTLKKLRNSFSHLDDFNIFKQLQDIEACSKINIDTNYGLMEARHYLTIAFSKLATLQIEHFDKDWGWFRWMSKHKENISCAFSLNYDLLLEQCFDQLKILHTSYELNGHNYGIPLAKPHGSVDFEIMGISINVSYPLKNFIDMNNTPINKLKKTELFTPRIQPLCIAPNEANKYIDYQWVETARRNFLSEVKKCTHCIFIGISYFECDRPEIDEIIRAIPKESEVIVANPDPNADFIDKLGDRPTIFWKSFNSPLNAKNEPTMLKNINSGKLLKKCFCGSGISYQYCHAI